MGTSELTKITVQNAILGATSALVAQVLSAYQDHTSITIDWIPVVQFAIFNAVAVPPNYTWQVFLEETFPSWVEGKKANLQGTKKNPKGNEKSDHEDTPPSQQKSVANIITKTLLDQTVGALFNTVLFLVFMKSLKVAMAPTYVTLQQHPISALADKPIEGSVGHEGTFGGEEKVVASSSLNPTDTLLRILFLFLREPKAFVDFSRVDLPTTLAQARGELWPMMLSGWKFWPFVSVVQFAVIDGIVWRNLFGSLAGLVWSVYLSLFFL